MYIFEVSHLKYVYIKHTLQLKYSKSCLKRHMRHYLAIKIKYYLHFNIDTYVRQLHTYSIREECNAGEEK